MTSAREDQNEVELSKLQLNAPRVTPKMVDAAITKAEYTVLQDGRSTVCLLTLDNGFTVRGESSCVSAENFDAAFGRNAAYEDARRRVWGFLAFRLADQLHAARASKLLPGSSDDTKVFAKNLDAALAQCELPAPAKLTLPIDIEAATGPALATQTISVPTLFPSMFDSSGAVSKV